MIHPMKNNVCVCQCEITILLLEKIYPNKCTCSDSGPFADVSAMRIVHCAVCRLQCAKELVVETG